MTTTTGQTAKLQAALDTLNEAVRNIRSSDDWAHWLRCASKFHKYSFGNVVLITCQRPDATRVAGFNRWKELGRTVKHGEKGIAILAPMMRKATPEELAQNPDARGRLIGFRVVYVFDVSQTDGKPLPVEPPAPALLDGDAPAGLRERLLAGLVADNWTVHAKDMPQEGMTDFLNRTVTFRPDRSNADVCSTLIHEWAHTLLHGPKDGALFSCREDREVEAESVAFLVAAHFGLDTGGYTFGYVAGWAKSENDVEKCGQRSVKAAQTILTRLGERLDD